jgi:hypothetical protein
MTGTFVSHDYEIGWMTSVLVRLNGWLITVHLLAKHGKLCVRHFLDILTLKYFVVYLAALSAIDTRPI